MSQFLSSPSSEMLRSIIMWLYSIGCFQPNEILQQISCFYKWSWYRAEYLLCLATFRDYWPDYQQRQLLTPFDYYWQIFGPLGLSFYFWLFFLLFHHVSDMENWSKCDQNRKYKTYYILIFCQNFRDFFFHSFWIKFGILAGVKKLPNVWMSSFQLINKPSGTYFTHFVRMTWRIKVFLRPGGKWFVPRPPR